MTTQAISDLLVTLKKYCPIDTGQLRGSIQPVQAIPGQFVVTIGNSTASTRSVPSNVYAAFTNNALFLNNGHDNPNHHWVQRALEEWSKKWAYSFAIDTEEEDEEE